MELDKNVQLASSRRSYTLSKDVLTTLETLVVTIVGSTELDGILSIDTKLSARRLGKFTEHRYKLRGIVK